MGRNSALLYFRSVKLDKSFALTVVFVGREEQLGRLSNVKFVTSLFISVIYFEKKKKKNIGQSYVGQ